jgi:L-ascorbate metabolism protein UlaG (beta-lactamase superfamily)
MLFIFTICVVFILGVLLFVAFAPQFGQKPRGEYLKVVEASPQYQEGKFQNSPRFSLTMNFSKIFSMLSDLVNGGEARRPAHKLPSYPLNREKPATSAYLTWFGHSTFLYQTSGKNILFDPMLGTYASPVPFVVKRYPYDLPSSADDLPPLDIVIISHDHYDHLDYGTVRKIASKTRIFMAPLGVGSHLRRWGVPKEKIIELDWWETRVIDGVTIGAVPSQHFSGRALSDRQKTLWAGWVIYDKTAKVFFGGDSGYFSGFKKIGDIHGPFDLTLLDSGQYNKNWEGVHMFPEESVQAHKDLRGNVFMPIHWSAFTLSTHSWTDPAERALIAARKENIDIITPVIGERFDILTDRPRTLWWRGEVL